MNFLKGPKSNHQSIIIIYANHTCDFKGGLSINVNLHVLLSAADMDSNNCLSMITTCLLIICILFPCTTSSLNDNPLLLLVSFDGFRYDYLQKVKESGRNTPNFDILRNNGVEARYVKNLFITATFPNHWSLVTGQYQESHGIISNIMYDPVYDEALGFASVRDSKMFNNGIEGGEAEPIWVTNDKNPGANFPRRSGVMFWLGSEVEIRGFRPDYWMKYDEHFPNESRIDHVIKWFTDDKKPINLGLLYFSQPDFTGHNVGPNSDEMLDLIVALDEVLGYLITELKRKHLFERLNLIITSDHGMAEIGKDNVIELDDHINPSHYRHYGITPVFNILPKPG